MTLGISSNTRLVSLAVVDNDALVDTFTQLHKDRWSDDKAQTIVAAIGASISSYSISKVVIAIPHRYHQTQAHQSLMAAVCHFFVVRNIPIITASPTDIAALCTEGKVKSNTALMELLVERFPELRTFHQRELRNKNKYYYKLFEAVAVACMAEQLLV
ncbi:MAG: hypothetical protein JST86_09635 [Bacteroidetes bacterium]|nr:hypothetical protein [Bacteroidota bacterium]